MVKLLLENKSPINATDIDSMTALHHAVSEGHGDAAVFLLKEGAQSDKRDSEGNLAIQLAPDVKVCQEIIMEGLSEKI
jgi:26S proteasome non-ATPase regulatory subunit 10